jgi:hypothetical protein
MLSGFFTIGHRCSRHFLVFARLTDTLNISSAAELKQIIVHATKSE